MKPRAQDVRPISLRQGPYCLFAELGSGSTATLYLAAAESALGFEKIHVLKCLKRDLAHEPEFFTMFVDEARLAARLEHPNVVRTVEVCVGDQAAIVMEYVEGCSLHQLAHAARSGRVHVERAQWITIVIEILAALDYAHNLTDFDGTPLGIVHRDVSPGNVLISSAGEVKLTDFGIAKAALRSGTTAVGTIKGKMHYMAPEHLGGGPADARADLFAVGVLLWELLAGRSPWNTVNPRKRRAIEPLSQVVAGAEPELDAICQRALASDPRARYQSADEMLRDLERHLAQHGRRVNRLELGRIVCDAVGGQLEECQRIVRAQLAKLRSARSQADWALLRLPEASESIPPEPTSVSLRPGAAPRRKRRGLIYGLALAGAAAAGAWFAWSEGYIVLAPAPASSVSPTTAADPLRAAASTAASEIEIYVVASPPEAVIYIDGVRMPANPHRGRVRNDDAFHRVRVEAPHHVTVEKEIAYTGDVVLRLRLERVMLTPERPTAPTAAPSVGPSPWDP